MTSGRRRPVARWRVLVTAALLLIGLGGIVALTEQLRHPPPEPDLEQEEISGPIGDPRVAPVCPELADRPREGDQAPPGAAAEAPPAGLVTSNALYDCPVAFDGRVVRYRGEVVGAVLHREVGAWVQLNDDVYAGDVGPLPAHRDFRGGNAGVGVLLPSDLATDIASVGGATQRGDVLEIVGTFHRVDPLTDEAAVIRARSGSVWRRGEPFPDPPLRDRRVAALVLVPLGVAAFAWQWFASRRR